MVSVEDQVVNCLWDIGTIHGAELDSYATELLKQEKQRGHLQLMKSDGAIETKENTGCHPGVRKQLFARKLIDNKFN